MDCPALIWDSEGRKYWCNLILENAWTFSMQTGLLNAREYLEAGQGCLCPNSWREDVKERSKHDVPFVTRYYEPTEAYKELLRKQYGRGVI